MTLRPQRGPRTLYVGNLDEAVTDKVLAELFYQAGPVVAAQKVPQKPYGFVEMGDESSADYAAELFLYGTVRLFGKYIRVQPSCRDSDSKA